MLKVLSNHRVKKGLCAKCDPEYVPKTEHIMRDMIAKLVGFEPSSIDVSLAFGKNCKDLKKVRPDFVYVSSERNVAIVVEIDEHCHLGGSYPVLCETAKISQQSEAIQSCVDLTNIPVITLRMNPDAYDVGKVSRQVRAEAVAHRIKEILFFYTAREPERTGYQRVEYFYYRQNARYHIDAQARITDVIVHDGKCDWLELYTPPSV